jgi:hypothetical protein
MLAILQTARSKCVFFLLGIKRLLACSASLRGKRRIMALLQSTKLMVAMMKKMMTTMRTTIVMITPFRLRCEK